jgi:hypothetical protein
MSASTALQPRSSARPAALAAGLLALVAGSSVASAGLDVSVSLNFSFFEPSWCEPSWTCHDLCPPTHAHDWSDDCDDDFFHRRVTRTTTTYYSDWCPPSFTTITTYNTYRPFSSSWGRYDDCWPRPSRSGFFFGYRDDGFSVTIGRGYGSGWGHGYRWGHGSSRRWYDDCRPVYVRPICVQPVYVRPIVVQPVIVHPAPIIVTPTPVIIQQPTVIVQPTPVIVQQPAVITPQHSFAGRPSAPSSDPYAGETGAFQPGQEGWPAQGQAFDGRARAKPRQLTGLSSTGPAPEAIGSAKPRVDLGDKPIAVRPVESVGPRQVQRQSLEGSAKPSRNAFRPQHEPGPRPVRVEPSKPIGPVQTADQAKPAEPITPAAPVPGFEHVKPAEQVVTAQIAKPAGPEREQPRRSFSGGAFNPMNRDASRTGTRPAQPQQRPSRAMSPAQPSRSEVIADPGQPVSAQPSPKPAVQPARQPQRQVGPQAAPQTSSQQVGPAKPASRQPARQAGPQRSFGGQGTPKPASQPAAKPAPAPAPQPGPGKDKK